jgi:hypothetical protein
VALALIHIKSCVVLIAATGIDRFLWASTCSSIESGSDLLVVKAPIGL